MGRHVSQALLLLLLLSLVVKFDASFVREHRKLAGENPTQGSPVLNQENSDPNHVAGPNKNKEEPPPTNNDKKNDTAHGNVKEGSNNGSNSNNTTSPAPSPLPISKDLNSPPKKDNKPAAHNVAEDDGGKVNEKGGDGKGNNGKGDVNGNEKGGGEGNGKNDGKVNGEEGKGKGGKIVSQSITTKTCDKLKHCQDSRDMVGCIFELDPTNVVILLTNGGNDTIKVKVTELNLEVIEVGTKKTKEVNISLITSGRTQLSFNAGHGDCVVQMGADISEGDNFIGRLPSYDKILTPVNGAYFLILTVLVFGGTWACCKFRKKRHDEVPYQELEMALPESASATNMESVEGWDQDWDDNWDDDVAVKPPGAGHARSISANGLTSRSANKDGWENNWDE